MDDALGHPRRAARIDDIERVAFGRLERRGAAPRGRHPRLELFVEHDALETGHEVIAELVRLRAVDEQVLRSAVGRHSGELLGARARGQRGGDPAGAHRGEEHEGIGNRRRAENRHRLPALEPARLEPRGDPLDLVVERAPRQVTLLVAQRYRVGLKRRPFGQHPRERAERRGEAGGNLLGGHLLASAFTSSNR